MKFFFFLNVFLLLSFFALGENSVPTLSTPVEDLGGFFTEEERLSLEEKIIRLQSETGVQAQILTVPSLKGESIESYSIRVVESWKLGDQGKDNGLLFTMSRDERKVRLEVGSGLEGEITDYEAYQILHKIMIPLFKKEEYYRGVQKALDYSQALMVKDPEAIAKLKPLPIKNSLGAGAFYLFVLTFFLGTLISSRSRYFIILRGLITGASLASFVWFLLSIKSLPIVIAAGVIGFIMGLFGFTNSVSASSGGNRSRYGMRGNTQFSSRGDWGGSGGGFSGGGSSGGW